MEKRQVLIETPDRGQDSAWTFTEAPRSIGRTAEYRGKVYLAQLHLERERVSLAPSRSKFSLFQKTPR